MKQELSSLLSLFKSGMTNYRNHLHAKIWVKAKLIDSGVDNPSATLLLIS